MKFTKKRMEQMLDILGKKAVEWVDASDIIKILRGEETWSGCFEDIDEGDGMVGILAKIIGHGKDCISEKEFDEIVLPHIARRIAEDLGAKEVIIRW